jgi:hypothetical protein
LLLEQGQRAEALRQYQTSIAKEPGRPRSVAGADRAAVRAGQHVLACKYYTELLLASAADTPLLALTQTSLVQLRRRRRSRGQARDRVLREAWLRRGDKVVDLGAGTGLRALEARRRVKGSGYVVAVDVSADALSECRRQAELADGVVLLLASSATPCKFHWQPRARASVCHRPGGASAGQPRVMFDRPGRRPRKLPLTPPSTTRS